ncbi:MAG: dihydroxy-acid dehydratase, partial [Bacteroidales bacterium]
DGDMIEIDIPNRSINLLVPTEEIERRLNEERKRSKEAFTPKNRKRNISRALKVYASIVSSADKGAIRMIE